MEALMQCAFGCLWPGLKDLANAGGSLRPLPPAPGNQLAHSVVHSQPSNSRGEEEYAGEVANVSLRPCKAGLGQMCQLVVF